MKIRSGFVSNSSSSSFVVIKPTKKMDETKEEVIKKYLDKIYGPYDEKEPYFKKTFDKILKMCEDINSFELIDSTIEMGGEEDIMSLLDRLGIKYIFEEY